LFSKPNRNIKHVDFFNSGFNLDLIDEYLMKMKEVDEEKKKKKLGIGRSQFHIMDMQSNG